MTFIAALRLDRIGAPWIIDGPINGDHGLCPVQVLAPTLVKGYIVILDNLASHKDKAARNAMRAKGAHLIFLPPPTSIPSSRCSLRSNNFIYSNSRDPQAIVAVAKR
jgi:hypothetical protein